MQSQTRTSGRQASFGSVSSLCDHYGGNWASVGDRLAESSVESTSNQSSLSKLPEETELGKVQEIAPELSPEQPSKSPVCSAPGAPQLAADAVPSWPSSVEVQAGSMVRQSLADTRDSNGAPPRPSPQLQGWGQACLEPLACDSLPGSNCGSERGGQHTPTMSAPRRPFRLHEWTVDHVASWVLSTPVDPEVATRLRDNAINGQVLESLTESDLSSMGITKFGWRRQLLLSRQELIQRLEERLKPPEGVEWMQIYSRSATPEGGSRGNHGTSTPPSTPTLCAGQVINGAGALPPPIARRIGFDPTFVPTPLSGAHARCVAAAASATSPRSAASTPKQVTRGVACRPTSPVRQNVVHAASGQRLPASTSTPKTILTAVPTASAASLVPSSPPAPGPRTSATQASGQRLLLQSPTTSTPRVSTPRIEWATAKDTAAAIAAALSPNASSSTTTVSAGVDSAAPAPRPTPGLKAARRTAGVCDHSRQNSSAAQVDHEFAQKVPPSKVNSQQSGAHGVFSEAAGCSNGPCKQPPSLHGSTGLKDQRSCSSGHSRGPNCQPSARRLANSSDQRGYSNGPRSSPGATGPPRRQRSPGLQSPGPRSPGPPRNAPGSPGPVRQLSPTRAPQSAQQGGVSKGSSPTPPSSRNASRMPSRESGAISNSHRFSASTVLVGGSAKTESSI